MTVPGANAPFVAIACGGTGGHLFPGLAVAEQLRQRGCAVALLVSPKEVDQQAVQSAPGLEIVTLPAVALQNRNYFSFARHFWQSWRGARKVFKTRPPHAVLAMGGFTSAPPVLAAKRFGAKVFLHESNTIPGRANRLLARFVDEAFVGFPAAAARLRARKVTTTGTPVRPQFWRGEAPDPARRDGNARPAPVATSRAALGLNPELPTILVMGGSQGASGLNDMILSALPLLADRASAWQWLHLTGPRDEGKMKPAYAARGFQAVVKPFLVEMDLALGAATAAVSRAGASALAEIAAMRLPSLLVPFPAAADNHQFYNAQAFAATGAARLLEQKNATPEKVAPLLRELVEDSAGRAAMQAALAQWHAPKAAEQIAGIMLDAVARCPAAVTRRWHRSTGSGGCTDPSSKQAVSLSV
jgi:UDP-N-acetylglucosamine--N-acetylmuramyl-(pentapeptide) pyrophosphoryl-undecaprenol N-acetylglucosamine transferase